MRQKQRLSVSLLLATALLLLQGCGFQLRGSGQALPAGISPVALQGLDRFDDLYPVLSRQLRAAGVEVADSGASRLRLSQRRSSRRVLSVDANGKVVEYELYEGVTFELTSRNGARAVEPQTVGVTRSHLNPEIDVLAKDQEEKALRRDMLQDLALRIISRLRAQLH